MAQNYKAISTVDELKILVDKIGEANLPFGLDCETGYSGPDRIKGSLDVAWEDQFMAGFSLSGHPSWARYVPTRHDFGPNVDEEQAFAIVKPLFETGKCIPHHAKFEKKNFRKVGIELNIHSDTMLESYVLSMTEHHGLKPTAKYHLDWDMTDITTLFPDATQKQLQCLRFNVLDLTPEVVAYACEDAAAALALHGRLRPMAEAERKLILALELEISEIMADVEDYGVGVDWEGIKHARAQAEVFSHRFEASVKRLLGEMAGRDLLTMNLASTKQLSELLYQAPEAGGLGLSTSVMTKGSEKNPPKMSTNAIALERLSRQHTGIRKLLELREVNNLQNRLNKWLEEYTFGADGRVHPSFGQAIVGTGRFAANDPAIQQLPKEWRWGADTTVDLFDKKNAELWEDLIQNKINGEDYWHGNFRDFIVAEDGNYLLTFDYSQGELRMLAGMAQEKSLLDAFENGVDVHTLTAAMMLGISPEEVSKEGRAIGKTMNFALVYQMGAQSLSERLAISKERADELYAEYFKQFPKVSTWIEKAKREGLLKGYAETYFGRKWTIWPYQSTNRAVYSKGDRVAVNAPVQGSLADYVKLGMVRTVRKLKEKGWWMNGATITMNQHDSLTIEASNTIDPTALRALVQPCVSFPLKGFPSMQVDWELGLRWGSSTSWKDQPVVFVDGQWRVDDGKLAEPGQPSKGSTSVQAAHAQPGTPEPPSGPLTVQPFSDQEPDEQPEGSLLHVGVDTMPTQEQFAKFISLVQSAPGQNTLKIITPQGEVTLPVCTALSQADQPAISLALGGASVSLPVYGINAESLAAGLEL